MTNDTDLIIDVTDAWVSGSTDIQSVVITELRGAPRFALTPSDQHERVAIARRHGYCAKCDGRGYIPTAWGKEMRAVPCPSCRGKCKGMDHADVRLGLLTDLCHGWEGWLSKSGAEVPFDPARLAAIAKDELLSGVILGYSQKMKKDVQEAEGKASEPGLEQQ